MRSFMSSASRYERVLLMTACTAGGGSPASSRSAESTTPRESVSSSQGLEPLAPTGLPGDMRVSSDWWRAFLRMALEPSSLGLKFTTWQMASHMPMWSSVRLRRRRLYCWTRMSVPPLALPSSPERARLVASSTACERREPFSLADISRSSVSTWFLAPSKAVTPQAARHCTSARPIHHDATGNETTSVPGTNPLASTVTSPRPSRPLRRAATHSTCTASCCVCVRLDGDILDCPPPSSCCDGPLCVLRRPILAADVVSAARDTIALYSASSFLS
mmetsp:Transcript_31456/g.89304  ORF Transcript_31456/g.89304 Transcript_31456/m.89304 type:complete len:275 (-) Transcript_31456:3254-4078(-)